MTTLVYAKITEQQQLQAYEWDEVLWGMHRMGLTRKGVETEDNNAVWRIPDFVWEAIDVDFMTAENIERMKLSDAPWITRRQAQLRGHRI